MLGLHESSVVGHGDRLGDRPRRAGARDPAHDRRARERGRRARDRAGQPGAARRGRRPAGSPPSRARSRSSRAGCAGSRASTRCGSTSPSVPQDVPGAIARAYHEAVTGRGPALVIVPMDDWTAEAGERTSERARRAASCGRSAADRDAVAELAELLDGGGSARRSSSGPAPTTPRPGPRSSRWPSGSRCPVWQESFSARAGFPAGSPALRRPPAGRPDAPARRRSRRTTSCSPSARRSSASTRTSPGPFVEAGTRVAMVSQDPAEVHRSPAELAVLAPPGAGVRRARADRAGARGTTPPGAVHATRLARAPRRGRAAPRRPRPRRPRRAPAARRGRDRGGAVEPAGAAGADPGARAARLPQPGDGRARLRAARRDRRCAWRGPTGRSSRSSATARRSTGSRRSGARRTTAPARCS